MNQEAWKWREDRPRCHCVNNNCRDIEEDTEKRVKGEERGSNKTSLIVTTIIIFITFKGIERSFPLDLWLWKISFKLIQFITHWSHQLCTFKIRVQISSIQVLSTNCLPQTWYLRVQHHYNSHNISQPSIFRFKSSPQAPLLNELITTAIYSNSQINGYKIRIIIIISSKDTLDDNN